MVLLDECIVMRWHNMNKERYVAKGYTFTKIKDVFYPKVKDVLECSSGVKIPVQCDYCKQIYYPTTTTYLKMRQKSQIDCCVACKGNKIKNTVQQKYGVDNVMYIPEVANKVERTCMEKYNAKYPLNNANIYNKTVESFNKHYGVENGIGDLRNIKELNEKIEHTNMIKYNGKSPFKDKKIRAKILEKMYHDSSCPTSKKQIELCEMLKKLYGNCELNYPCDNVSLDCMVVVDGVKFDIEYDGWYWHQYRIKEDTKRNFFVGRCGYKIIRIIAYKHRLPDVCEIQDAISKLLTTNKKIIIIELK